MKYIVTYYFNSRYYSVKICAKSKFEAIKMLLEMTEYKAYVFGANEFIDTEAENETYKCGMFD